MKSCSLLIIGAIVASVNLAVIAESPSSTSAYLSSNDKARLKKILEPGLELKDLSAVYYAVYGYKLIGEPIPSAKEICKYITTEIGDGKSATLETIFYAASTWKELEVCQTNTLPISTVSKTLTQIVEKDTSAISDLYYAVSSLIALTQKISDSTIGKLVKTLQAAIRKEDSLWNLGYTFHIASDLGSAGSFALSSIEDAVIQADEVDGQHLQFEGGLSVTSFIINGIFKLSTSLNKKPPLTSQQVVKFANYLLSRRSVQLPKGVVSLLSAVETLAVNSFEKPVCIMLAPGGNIVSNKQPLITLKVCDILGKPLPNPPKVILNTATRMGDDVVILKKKNFQASGSDNTLFTINFMENKPDWGFYKVSVSAGSVSNELTINVLSEISVDHLEIGTGDADQTTQPKLTRVTFPNKLSEIIEADSQQKLVIRFSLKDAISKKTVRVHQAFVRLSSASDAKVQDREIIFVAEPDASNLYKFDLPVGAGAVNFDHRSGNYNVELIIGDTRLSNPFQWHISTVNLKFPESSVGDTTDKNMSHKQKPNIYKTKQEIKHMFRQPEKRPPAFVSNLFTGLCLSPVLLLLILWIKLEVNISNFPFSASAVLFHVGLGSIFVLFGIFWLQLNMFVTLRYLLGIGVVTFLAGNKLLSQIAQRYKSLRDRS
ncbi:dolichyl-diphosphooligosaccharide--protein glycosyltransferase subunit 2 [Prorops nasuta]|uniref:dolichyl-diphosphooligosaccharide--protein glycosyltransferase subunit 2 n=1 Tax=Prorops nasuta TaxID=863751 RepID=UPI0034CEA1AF